LQSQLAGRERDALGAAAKQLATSGSGRWLVSRRARSRSPTHEIVASII
jgi:hypothetical protein